MSTPGNAGRSTCRRSGPARTSWSGRVICSCAGCAGGAYSLACAAGLDEDGFPCKPDARARESVLHVQLEGPLRLPRHAQEAQIESFGHGPLSIGAGRVLWRVGRGQHHHPRAAAHAVKRIASAAYALARCHGVRPAASAGSSPMAQGKNSRPSANGEWITPQSVSAAGSVRYTVHRRLRCSPLRRRCRTPNEALPHPVCPRER